MVLYVVEGLFVAVDFVTYLPVTALRCCFELPDLEGLGCAKLVDETHNARTKTKKYFIMFFYLWQITIKLELYNNLISRLTFG